MCCNIRCNEFFHSKEKSSAMDSHEQLGGDRVSSKCTTKFGVDGGQICMPMMSTHIAPKFCSVKRRCIHNVRTCKSKSEIGDVPNRTIAGDYDQRSRGTIPFSTTWYWYGRLISVYYNPFDRKAPSPSRFVRWIQLFPKKDQFSCLFVRLFGPAFVREPSPAAPD